MSVPAAMSASMMASVSLAGPTVAMIFVCRILVLGSSFLVLGPRIASMGQIVPDAIEGYLASLNRAADPVLEEIARGNATRGLPLVDAEVGAFLRVLATAIGARHMLEIGTAIGYSGIWL